MIAYLKGKILRKNDKGLILETNNIGYFIYLSKNTLPDLIPDNTADFFIHTDIKDDGHNLYGFPVYEDLEFFKKLITINGIGPKVALEILNIPQNNVKSALINEDEAFICKIPGIGKKTAKRLILELKESIDINDIDPRQHKTISEETHNDAVDALIKLGYQRNEILKTVEKAPTKLTKAEDIITFFLKNH